PDQWPKEYWDQAFAQIKGTGFEVVRFGEMAWDWLEPGDSSFKFKELDAAMDLCGKHGLKVILGTAIAQAPQWLISRYPDILPIAHDGSKHPEYGPRPNACRDNPNFRRYAKRLVEKLASRYSRHPSLFMWQLDNEPGYPPLDLTENKDWCHCEATRKAFLNWAKNKYGSIDRLNAAWGTKFWVETFSNFSEIKTPKGGMWDAGNPHIYLDWFRFKSESISEWLLFLKEIVRKHDRTHKIGTNSFTSIPNRIPDHSVIARGMDWFGWDIYPKGTMNPDESLAQIADYWKGVCKQNKAEFWVMELQAGPNVRWGYPGRVTGEEIKRWTKILVEHGAKGIMYFNWRPPLFGSETGGFGLLNADGSPSDRLQAVKEIIKSYEGEKSIFRLPTNRLAIYHSKTSEIQTFQEEGFPRPCPPIWFCGRGEIGMFYGLNSLAGAYRLVHPYGAEFLFDEQLEQGELECEVLLLTNPYTLSKKQFEHLREFLEDGGKVVTEARFGMKDEMGHLYPTPLISNIVKSQNLSCEIIEEDISVEGLANNITGFKTEGQPNLGVIEIGKGKLIYANFSLFPNLTKPGNEALVERIRKEIDL
ncbi:beta-galactosidase, partial [Patescibacteria group bacterium]|nr:beta-galactosidase [Patescibacteria group bacterium]